MLLFLLPLKKVAFFCATSDQKHKSASLMQVEDLKRTVVQLQTYTSGLKSGKNSTVYLCTSFVTRDEEPRSQRATRQGALTRSTLMHAASLHLGRLERRRRLPRCRSNCCIIPSQSTLFFCCRETGIIDVCALKISKGPLQKYSDACVFLCHHSLEELRSKGSFVQDRFKYNRSAIAL